MFPGIVWVPHALGLISLSESRSVLLDFRYFCCILEYLSIHSWIF